MTERVVELVRRIGVRAGLVSIWSMHTTCAVFINEIQGALHADIKRFLEETVVARRRAWMHNDPKHSDCDRNNADAHLRAMLLGHSLTVQLSGGELVLGQWQRIICRPSSTARAPDRSAFDICRGSRSSMQQPPCARSASPTSPKARGARAPDVRRRRAAVRMSGPAGARLAGESRARAAPRRAHLLQLQHPARGDQRLRRELPVLLVRAAAARRSRLVHDVARAGLGQAAAARRISRSPKSTSSTACIRICRSTTTWSCCAASSASGPAFI